jgi:tRNA-dihydrouridine synthase 1
MDFVMRRYLDIIHEYALGTGKPDRKPLFDPSVDTEVDQTEVKGSDSDGKNEKKDDHADGPAKKKQKRGKPQKPTSPNLGYMRGHLFDLLRPLVSLKTHVRDELARAWVGDIPAFERVLSLVEEAVKEGMREYEAHPERFEADPSETANLTGSRATIAEYGRPWWICQPYIRRLPEEALEVGALQLSKKEMAQREAEAAKLDVDGKATESGKENVSPKEQAVQG